MEFIYTALIQDNDLESQDQDYEFPACFVVEAPNKKMAQSWGINLAMEHCLNNPAHMLLNSLVESIHNYPEHVLAGLPKIQYGAQASDEVIGW